MLTKKITLLILSILLLASFSFSQKKIKESNKQLIGQWATVSQKGEKSQTIITFHPDGKVEYNIAAIIEGTYFLRKNLLITYFNDPKSNSTEVDTSIIKIVEDTLYQNNLHRGGNVLIKSIKLGRKTVGGGIIGRWLTESFNGHKAIQQFRPDNLVHVDLIVRSINGSYTVSGNTLTLNLMFTPVIKSKFEIKNNKMTIEQIGKTEKSELIKIDEY
jgi:hypothetical protein